MPNRDELNTDVLDESVPGESVPDVDIPITNTDEDFPDSWNDEPGDYSHNEPEAEPLADPSPLDPSQL